MDLTLNTESRNHIFFSKNGHEINVGGRSLWFNSINDWKSIFRQVNALLKKDKVLNMDLNLSFEMIDSKSMPKLIEFIKGFKSHSMGDLIWSYEDEDMKDLGEDLENVLGVQFTFRQAS